ncbi:hypothetical protein PAL_GLEAN10022570 [Pteropus alecto]|uniref:Uncharacterized protein n=1 Tax=Pteropus alecto TaxID=9402 RepID=L5K4X9_PTEAL|nr:hypothetical protein PAL_GLEAN10022570 [Pteropus alecto]
MCHHTVRKSWNVCKLGSGAVGSMPNLAFEGSGHGSAPGADPRVARWPLSLSSLSQALQEARGPVLPIGLHLRLHGHFDVLQVAGCCSFEGGGGPGAPRASAD